MSKFGLAKALELLESNDCDMLTDTSSACDSDVEPNEPNKELFGLECSTDTQTISTDLGTPQTQGVICQTIQPIVVYIEEQNSFENETTMPDIESTNEYTTNETNIATDTNNNANGSEIPKRGRKRIKDDTLWAQNVRKRQRQSGQEYINSRGLKTRAREIKTVKDCKGHCKYICTTHFTAVERKNIFDSFWELTDTEKNTFYAQTTDRTVKATKRTLREESRRAYSIKYHLPKDTDRIRVCKQYYLSTLDISSKRIEYFYKRQGVEEVRFEDRRGGHSKKRVHERDRKRIQDHIDMFPRVPSHYCRATTTKEYLEANLTISKMYRMYRDMCVSNEVEPQTECIYRKILKTDFNLGFFKPKKDRCDTCEEFKVSQPQVPILKTKYDAHVADKHSTREERKTDRENTDDVVTTVCFDMEKVLVCPRSNVSNFFYKRKLNVYNLTAHCSTLKTAYNVLWTECIAGRGANEIASALVIILEKVIENYPHIQKFVLWSDSCVPQNRNSIMSIALMLFLHRHTQLVSIEQKYCTPGHSCIQEVDNIHSHIEKHLSKVDIYSPLSLIRNMKEIRKEVMDIHQMKADEIFDFQDAASSFKFKEIPYTRVKSLTYKASHPFHIDYRVSFQNGSAITEASLRRQTRSTCNPNLPVARVLNKVPVICELKKKDIESMLRFMPLVDRYYMERLLQIGDQRQQ